MKARSIGATEDGGISNYSGDWDSERGSKLAIYSELERERETHALLQYDGRLQLWRRLAHPSASSTMGWERRGQLTR